MINLVNSVYFHNHYEIYNREPLKKDVKEELEKCFGLVTKKQKLELLVDYYGLTGAGF